MSGGVFFGLRLFWRDLRGGRLLVLWLSLAVATATATGISIGAQRFGDALYGESSEWFAADARLRSDEAIPDEWLARARRFGLMVSRTLRFSSMLFAGGELKLASVKAVDGGYPLRGSLRVGARPFGDGALTDRLPARGEVWLDSRLFQSLGVAVGDTVDIGEAAFHIGAVLASEPDPSVGFESFSPRALMRLDDVEATGVIKPGSRHRWYTLFAGARGARAQWREWMTPRLLAGQRLEEIGSDDSRLGGAVARAEGFLLLAGSLAILLAGLAIAVAARHYAASHYDQVAILKSLGAGETQIARMYIGGFAALCAAGVVCGWALGYGAQEWAVRAFAEFFPVALPAPGLQPFAVGALTAFAALFAFAWPPLWRLAKVPPLRVLRRDAAGTAGAWLEPALGAGGAYALLWWYSGDALLAGALVGVGGAVAAALGALTWWLLGKGGILGAGAGGRVRLALASLRRDRLLNSAHVLAFGIAIMLVLLLALLRGGLLEQWRVQLPENVHTHFLVNIGPGERDELSRRLVEERFDHAPLHPMTRARYLGHAPDQEMPRERRFAEPSRWTFMLSWSEDPPPADELTAGRWFAPDERGVSVAAGFAEEHDVRVGDVLRFALAERELTAPVRSLRKVDWGRVEPGFVFVFSPETLRGAAHVYMTSLRVPPRHDAALYRVLAGFPTVSVLAVEQMIARVRSIIQRASVAVEVMLVLVAVAGALALFAGVRYSMAARRRQAALLRALGAGSGLLQGALAIEFALLGLLAGVIAALGAEAVGAILQTQVFGLDYRPYPWLWLAGVLSGVVGITALGLAAGRRALRVSPLRALSV